MSDPIERDDDPNRAGTLGGRRGAAFPHDQSASTDIDLWGFDGRYLTGEPMGLTVTLRATTGVFLCALASLACQ